MLDTARTKSQVLILKTVCSPLDETMLTEVRLARRSTVMVTLAVPGLCCTGIIFTGAKDKAEPSLGAGPRCGLACEVWESAGWPAMSGRNISAGLVVAALVAAVTGGGAVVGAAEVEVTGGPILSCTTPTGSFLNSLLVDPPGILSSLLGAMPEEVVVEEKQEEEEEEQVVEVVVVTMADVSVVVVVVAQQVAVTVVASKGVVVLDIKPLPIFSTGRAWKELVTAVLVAMVTGCCSGSCCTCCNDCCGCSCGCGGGMVARTVCGGGMAAATD